MEDEAIADGVTFESFFNESFTHFLGLARLLTGDPGRAEDLAQETYWRVHRAWDGLREREAAPAYTRTVMVRLAVRSRRRRWNGEQPEGAERLDVLSGGADDAGIEEVDRLDLLGRALGALPMNQRAVLVLRYFDERTEAEIASLLRCSPGTVKSRSARALAALRQAGLATEEGVATPGAAASAGPDRLPDPGRTR